MQTIGYRVNSCHTRILTEADDPAADEFVLQHPSGTPFHLSAWKRSIAETYPYKPVYLIAENGGQVCGLLPMFFVQNLLTGRALISTPFAVYGGILAEDPETARLLNSEAARLAGALRAGYLELRNHSSTQLCGHAPVDRYATFSRAITANQEELLAGIPRKTRYMVRKSLQQGFSMDFQSENIDAFYRLYSQNLQRLGTPCFSKNHFRALLDNFRGKIDLAEVRLSGRVIAAVMTFYFRDRVMPYYGAADPAYNNLAPSTYMYFELMRISAEKGFSSFDFGRSKKNCGSFDFKAHWGMEERSLPYEVLLTGRRQMPNYSPQNPKFSAAIQFWKRLPLPITRAIGPALVRLVP